jgi:hypothetical protein
MSSLMKFAVAGALILSLANSPSAAQASSPTDPAGLQPSLKRADETSRQSENGAVEEAPQTSDVTIVAGKDKSTAKISASRELAQGKLVGTLSTPINKNDDATHFFSLEGPAEDVQLGIAWKRQSYDLDLLANIDLIDLNKRRSEICTRAKVPAGKPCDDTELESAMKGQGKSSAEIANELEEFFTVKRTNSKTALPLFRAIPFYYLSVEGSVGRTERQYFALEGTEKDESRPSYSLGLTYGRVFQASRATLSLTAQRNYEEGKKARNCSTVDGSTLQRCKELPLGEAEEIDSVPFSIEYRLWRGRWAVSPKLGYDLKREVATGSLPIYIFADSEGRLTGGIRVDWEDGKDAVASVFVSSPLGLE